MSIKVIIMDVDGTLSNSQKVITPKTKVIALAHVTNVIGDIRNIKEIITLAHQKDILVVVDASQSIPHQKVDVQALDIDFLAFSAHKMCGPTGVGVLYGKRKLLNNINKIKPCSQVIGIWMMLEVDDIYPFIRNELNLMKDIRNAIKNNPLSFTTLYYYDLYPCTVAGEIIGIPKKEIMDNYRDMSIHKRSDIVIDSYDLINHLNIEDGPMISKLWKEIEVSILNLEVNNAKEELLNFAKKIYTNINLEKEEFNEAETTD